MSWHVIDDINSLKNSNRLKRGNLYCLSHTEHCYPPVCMVIPFNTKQANILHNPVMLLDVNNVCCVLYDRHHIHKINLTDLQKLNIFLICCIN